VTVEPPRIGIIGAGPSGIACGRALLERGFTDFTILEAMDAPGGTWRVLRCTQDRLCFAYPQSTLATTSNASTASVLPV
jgi:cation diffusion facilitator CzcD-associated flavoprotein CzcO